MKRFICLILVFVCAFSLFSCGNADGKAFIALVNESDPTNITTQTTYVSGKTTLNGNYITEIDGEDYTMTYTYQRYADPVLDGGDSYIKTVEGVVYYKDGKYSEDGENWAVEAPGVETVSVKFNLDLKSLGDYAISSDGKTLTTNITAKQVEKILGISVAAETVALTIVHNGVNLTYVTVSYTTTSGAQVTINTSYTYN